MRRTRMLIGDLTEHEIGMLVVALKYWRAHRGDAATRRTDPVLTADTVDLLLAKLGAAASPTIPDTRRNALDLFPR